MGGGGVASVTFEKLFACDGFGAALRTHVPYARDPVMRSRLILLFLFLSLMPNVALGQTTADTGKRSLGVGVVVDGPSERLQGVLDVVQKELIALAGSEFDVQFAPTNQRVGDWTRAGAEKLLDQLLQEPSVNLVLAFGVIASDIAVHRQQVPKACIAPFVVDERLQGLLDAQGKPRQVPNLSYIVWGVDIRRDLQAFAELGTFHRMAWIHNAYATQAVPGIAAAVLEGSSASGVELVAVPAKTSAQEILAAIPEDVDSAYVAPNTQLPLTEIPKLATGLIERKLPSFAWHGHSDVAQGLLAGLATEEDQLRLARRVALNAQSILLGDDPSELVASFKQQEQLTVNMATARALGVWPNWSVLTDAVLLNQQRSSVQRHLDLSQAVKAAMDSNLDLATMRQALAVGHQEISKARATLLPQLGVSATASMIDADRAGFGTAERMFQWGGSMNQLIYDQRAWANLSIQEDLQRSREFERDQLRLDVTLEVAVAYLNLLQAKTVERIRRENLKLSRENLALARMRQRLGTARPGEVLRWEAQIASSRSDVITAAATRNQLEILVNRLLNRPLEESFETKETKIDDPELFSSEQHLRDYLDNPFLFKTMRAFLVEEGLRLAPELKRINAVLGATESRKRAASRSLYVPSFGLSASVTHRAWRDGAGSEPLQLPPGTPSLPIPNPDNVDWMVGVNASLPLYEGGRRYAEINQAGHELARLETQRRQVKNLVGQRVRASMHQVGASFAAIRLSRAAATAAKENFKLVSDAYSRGSTSIVTLLDAQNQALIAELSAANASYRFLVDMMQVERAIGAFGFFASKAQRQSMFQRLDAYQRSRATQLDVKATAPPPASPAGGPARSAPH